MAEIIPKPTLLNSSSVGDWLLEEVDFFRLLNTLFFIFIMFYDAVDDKKNDKPDEEAAEKTFNH